MKRSFILIIIACCAFVGTQAMPAYPRRVKIVAERDSFYLTLHGDERFKFAVTDDGYTVLPSADGWYYACINDVGEVTKSRYKVSLENEKDATFHSFLEKQSKGIIPQYKIDSTKTNYSFNSQLSNLKGNPMVGERRILIILMQFSDVKFKKSQSDFDRLFNEQNYREDGAYGSVYDYYNKVSYGQLQLRCDVLGPYNASRNMAYYGGNSNRTNGDMNPKALFDEAIRYAIQEVNLSDYDSDGNGYVDNVHIIFAGYGEEAGASTNAIWSHEMTFRSENIGGMMIDRYSCSPELRGNSGNGITRIGPPCHEIGHALGAMDYYDVDYQTGGYYEGTGDWDVMASGSWNDDGVRPADFNPYVKAYNFGWVDVQTLEIDSINIISPSTIHNNIYRIDTPVSGDFFLLDNRQSEGVNSAEPGKGLLIFHVGPQIIQKELTNTINSTYPQQCYVVCASAKEARPRASASSYGSISSAGCPFPGTTHNTSFTNLSVPGAFCINGKSAGISLTDITQMDNGDISLNFENKDSDDTTSPEEPIDNDEEINGDIVWSDDFEMASHFKTQNWIMENIRGNATWHLKAFSATPSEKEPPLLSGNMYMAMESSETGTIMGKESRYSCRIVSNEILLSAGDYILTGKYGGYFSQKISQDTLYVELKSVSANNWIGAKYLHIKNKSEWDGFILPINITNDRVLRIAFRGSANEKSILFLDNVRLYRPYSNSVIQNIIEKDNYVKIYNMRGLYLGSYNVLNSLPAGVYIVLNGKNIQKYVIHK
ncbi:MAG: M6 family metalloprotease domain-containing protein [Prevotella sp.]|nr:M6 family metalloprotease domain-containing protein [Prevotella sp.]